MPLENELSEDSTRFELMRVLVELGKQNVDVVLPLLEHAIRDDDHTLRWTALHELLQIGKHHPEQVVSLLEHIMDQSAAPQQPDVLPVLSKTGHYNLDEIIPEFQSIMKGNDIDLQWLSILELIEIAAIYPSQVIPLFEQALQTNNEHIKWMITLELFELAKRCPDDVSDIFSKIIEGELKLMPANTTINKDFSMLGTTVEDLSTLEHELESSDINTQWLAAVKLITLARLHPQTVAPFLTQIMEKKSGEGAAHITRILAELDRDDVALALPRLEHAMQDDDKNVQSAVLLELFDLLQDHIDKLTVLFNKKLPEAKSHKSHAVQSQLDELQKITHLIEKVIEHNHPDLQWNTVHKLVKLKLFTPHKLVEMMGKVVQKRIETHDKNIAFTRILVVLGQKYPELTETAFKRALSINNAELHWAAMLELQALIKMSPKIASFFNDINH